MPRPICRARKRSSAIKLEIEKLRRQLYGTRFGQLAPPSMMRARAAHLKNDESATLPESGHSVAWEQPELFNEKVLAFIVRN
jgi:pimeloyl-ACP methyl ester carboxylesterase